MLNAQKSVGLEYPVCRNWPGVRQVSERSNRRAKGSSPPSGWNESARKYHGIRERNTREFPIHRNPDLPETTFSVCSALGQLIQVLVRDIEVLIREPVSIFIDQLNEHIPRIHPPRFQRHTFLRKFQSHSEVWSLGPISEGIEEGKK